MQIKYRSELWRLLRPDSFVAEVGVAEGRFSLEIIQWPIIVRHLYLVDRWCQVKGQNGDGGFDQAWHDANFAQVKLLQLEYGADRITLLRSDSVKAAATLPNNVLDLVYIDANHAESAVWADNEAWFPKVKKGGILAWHDYENPRYGVKKAVQKFCQSRGITINPIPENHPNDAGAWILC